MHLKNCLLLALILLVPAKASPIARPGCNETCGNLQIPFPFGIGPECSAHKWYTIECRTSSHSNGSSKPFLSEFDVQVLEISYDNITNDISTQTVTIAIPPLNVCTSETQSQRLRTSGMDFRGTPYSFSTQDNVLVMEGCPGGAVLLNQSKSAIAGCATICNSITSAAFTKDCYGSKCCVTPLSLDDSTSWNALLQSYHVDFSVQSSGKSRNCIGATLLRRDSVNKYVGKLSNSTAPAVLTWKWMNSLPLENSSHSSCNHLGQAIGMHCSCHYTYLGNPYVTNGCQVHAQCKNCTRQCLPSSGNPYSYVCVHDEGPDFKVLRIYSLLVVVVPGFIVLVIGFYGLYRLNKRRRKMKLRSEFFKRNGGLLLEQQLSSNDGIVDKTKIFTITELNKATDRFNDNRILGQGGQGTVYKGMLTDGRIVAVKKSKLLDEDENQLHQFINEVVILSQTNHRNVVRLLGCCLESQVPLLVYEFIPNGTLSDHIHDPDEDFAISWEMRLKIAADSAAAIAYLHSSSSAPIYHRDIKSSNILLDEKHRAKVSDFGISRTTPVHISYFVTDVRGTFGYVDPEYFRTLRFTAKSDVYSFGVVLLELLTGEKAVYGEEPDVKNLATEFLHLMDDNRLPEILDPEIAKQATEDELAAVIELARRCLSWDGKLRPTMKEVAMALEMIMKSPAQVYTWDQRAFSNQDEGLREDDDMVETEINEVEFMSNPLPSCALSPLCIDVKPLLPHNV